ISREDYLALLDAAEVQVQAQAPAPSPAAVLLAKPQPAASLPGFEEGLVSVQDGAAQMAPGFLELQPGQRVLDACAAPGGKTAHILESCRGLSELWAVDRDQARL